MAQAQETPSGKQPATALKNTPKDNSASTSTTSSAPRPRVTPDTRKQQQALLSQAVEGEELITLTAEGEPFFALWKPDISGTPLGAIILFHGEGQHQDWPQTILKLRETLPHFGWATLSITLPDPVPPPPPEIVESSASQTTETSEQTASTPATPQPSDTRLPEPTRSAAYDPEATEAKSVARAQAARRYLNDKGQFNIVLIGHGVGAARAAHFLNLLEKEVGQTTSRRVGNAQAIIRRPIRAMALINARNHIPYTPSIKDKMLIDWINDKQLPVLDIYTNAHQYDVAESARRLRAARAKQLKSYFQVRINSPLMLDIDPSTDRDRENILSKRVRGFLTKHAKGVKIE